MKAYRLKLWLITVHLERVFGDLEGLNSPMAKAYNVSALPVSFLLDGEGNIIAKNLRGEGLARKLEELF